MTVQLHPFIAAVFLKVIMLNQMIMRHSRPIFDALFCLNTSTIDTLRRVFDLIIDMVSCLVELGLVE